MKSQIVFLVFLIGVSQGVKFQLFRDFDYKGLYYESENDGKNCTNVVAYGEGTVGSVYINNCIIAYEESDCIGHSIKLEPENQEMARLMKPIKSYHVCNDSLGGERIHIDLYHKDELLGSFPDICDCLDLPAHIATNTTKMFNYMNCVTVYSANGCQGRQWNIPAGRSTLSDDLSQLESYIRSIRACGDKPQCVELDAKIFRFELFPEDTVQANDDKKDLELSTKTVFYNNGSATVTQVYIAEKTITETYTMKRSESITKVKTFSVEPSFHIGISAEKDYGDGNKIGGKVGASLKLGYGNEETDSSSSSSEYTSEEKRTYSISQTIEVPPCSQYEVSSMISVTQNTPIYYDVYLKVSGKSSGMKMTNQDLKNYVTDMTFEYDVDDYTAVFKTRDMLFANTGIDTKITGEGTEIPGCLSRERAHMSKMMPNVATRAVRKEFNLNHYF